MNTIFPGSLLLVILIPAALAVLILIGTASSRIIREITALAGMVVNLTAAIFLYNKDVCFEIPWAGFGMDFSLKLYHFSSFILLASSGFSFLVVMYSIVFMHGRPFAKQFHAYLLFTVAFVNGAVLANNLVVMLFFWEGLLVMLFAMILTGGASSHKTAVKAFVMAGLPDLCMMVGIGMTGYLANTLTIDRIHLPLTSWGIFAFICMMTGAISKAGAMPFHTWIPDAASDAPLPFMAFLPAALEKLLGIYFLARICLDMFDFQPGSSMSYLLMTIGSVTILCAVMMALIQKDFKRLLSYHAISQVGYMMLGIGTALPVGIVGGLFHMLNHAMYKSCLFLTGGAVERQAGTTDLKRLSGLGRKMPVTFTCFIVAAAAISGVPPLNGFFSKELIFDSALESGTVFYIAAALGAFFTAVSFLKLGHAAFLGNAKGAYTVKEAPWPMLVPMIILSAGCVLFGIYNSMPLCNLIQPILGSSLQGISYAGLPHNWILVSISVGVLLFALLDHLYGSRRTDSGLGAADHFHHAPVLSTIYGWADRKYFDLYHIGAYAIYGFSKLAWWVDRGIDRFYDSLTVRLAAILTRGINKAYSGSHSVYLGWTFAGIVFVFAVYFLSV